MKYGIAALTILGLATATAAIAQTSAPKAVKSDIVQAGGGKIGEVTLTNGRSGVLLRLTASGLTPGWHAMHFHATGDCSDQGFQKSGAHINHEDHKTPHGLLNPEGPDFGELPNIHVAADGTVNAEAFSALVSLDAASSRPNLLDADGSALVIHASPDDHVTQPIGGAGARVACAVIR
ncbi:MAG: superoxide dismutase [Novosphingobium sp. 32-60-15]|jgi:superoxide dismutase, Cu-Zn family|uniref:Superoxide dismutase [Cu-Zn] n=1 Tax=Novosphingobium pentaromativorans US6-1 TaxID=1088721 RepID=G6EJI8_9SPHN|nr:MULTISPECIES: superoxide dismutase family protein [Novosphingobium]AIT82376.1 superoxide dismutase [Novosphingobium pentaromativorans US6-1]EHJ58515.1 superoxide dismutase, copper/zinc binding [Novosphingobium pentaromativorans US6-1]KKC25586.1 superoxide dismutase [Sphingomonas sp. SRS2]OYX59672.1 MAG: superoxide dismutase [Novosphingobium sp. 32-60-15]